MASQELNDNMPGVQGTCGEAASNGSHHTYRLCGYKQILKKSARITDAPFLCVSGLLCPRSWPHSCLLYRCFVRHSPIHFLGLGLADLVEQGWQFFLDVDHFDQSRSPFVGQGHNHDFL
jgi:hypothetical protein